MADQNGSSPSKPKSPKSAVRSPGKSRLASGPASALSTITERVTTPIPPIPRRSSRRTSQIGSPTNHPATPRPVAEGRRSQDTQKTGPPAYDWVPESLDDDEKGNAPVEGAELAALRRKEGWRTPQRGGWGRLWLIIGVIVVVILALAIGLGVGLSQRGGGSSGDDGSSPSEADVPQKFPLGEYSLTTALITAETTCTSNPATWRCYPFTTLGSGSESESLAPFNWIIANTEDDYATADSASTPNAGVPANLTVSSDNDVFGIMFGTKPLTYISSASNETSSRYTFSFTTTKKVIPETPITNDGSTAICFFNETLFTANIYLNAARNYPSGSDANSVTLGGFAQWPHAVEILESASGGTNVPNCYKTVDGNVGDPITDAGLVPLGGNTECLCAYRNYY